VPAVVKNFQKKQKTLPYGRGFLSGEVLRYIFALAGVRFFLSRFATFLLLTTLLLLPALLFFLPALIVRTIALLTLLVHATLFAIHCHSFVSILDCNKFGAGHGE
jgi:hypothetical protein